MAKEGRIRTAKGILYVLSRVAIVIVVIVVIIMAFYTAMHTMNVRMVAKDALTERAQVVLIPAGDGSEDAVLERLFTQNFLSTDPALTGDAYASFQIRNYYQRTDIATTIIWPWEDHVTLRVTDLVTEISGLPLDSIAEDGTIISSEGQIQKPPAWDSGVYEVKMVKTGDNAWKVDSMKLVEVVEAQPTGTIAPEESPETSASAEQSVAG